MNKRLFHHLCCHHAGAALVAGGGAFAQTKWDMPTPYPDGNFHTKNLVEFAEEINTKSNGKLTITLHSNGSLIKHPEIKRAVQTGQVPIGEVLISVLANESPLYAFDSNPFLADSYDDVRKALVGRQAVSGQAAGRAGHHAAVFGAVAAAGHLHQASRSTSVADLKGTKFRTYSPTTSRFAELIGAVPTTVQVPEVPQAFRTGLVDAMITSGSTGVDTQAWDYLTHYYDVQAFLPQNMVIVSKAALDALDPATRKVVQDAAAARRAARLGRIGCGKRQGREDHGGQGHQGAEAVRHDEGPVEGDRQADDRRVGQARRRRWRSDRRGVPQMIVSAGRRYLRRSTVRPRRGEPASAARR